MRGLLEADSDLMEVIPASKIFPLVVGENVKYPYITYVRDNIYPQYTKAAPCGGWTNSVSITYRVYTGFDGSAHDLGEDLANRLRNALEWNSYQDEDIKIHPIELSSAIEYFSEDGFCQQLTFTTQVE